MCVDSLRGTVDAAGAYLAPEAPGTYLVQASLDASNRAQAHVRVIAIPFGANPGSTEAWEVGPGERINLPVEITGMEEGLSHRILWRLEGPDGGARLTGKGRLKAPVQGGCVAVGRSEADPSRVRRIAFTVVLPDQALGNVFDGPTQVTVLPSHASSRTGVATVLTARVTNASSQSVSWRLAGDSRDATVDRDGIFLASRAGIYRVVATSRCNPASFATVEVDVAAAIEETRHDPAVPLTKGGGVYIHAGGSQVAQAGGWDGSAPADSVILWDAQAKEPIRLAGHLKEARLLPLGAALGSGRILVCNGLAKINGADALLRSAEVFDLGTGSSRALAPMRYAHCGGSILALADGRVLVLGGDDGNGVSSGAELFDPSLDSFVVVAAQAMPIDAVMVALADGRVLVLGGRFLGKHPGPSQTILAFDPSSSTFTTAGALVLPRSGHSSTLLADGRVLTVGGRTAGKPGVTVSTRQCEVFDPGTRKSSPVGDLCEPRGGHAAVLMPNGQVLVMGGEFWNQGARSFASTIETYDPGAGAFSVFDRPRSGIVNPALFLLPNGSIFTGGTAVEFNDARNTALSNPCH